jgi:protein-S-isoprenylcysteine O-methyltransferase Ste14
MVKRMTVWGIGPRLFVATVLFFLASSYASRHFQGVFNLDLIPRPITQGLGIGLLIAGTVFFIATQITFIKEYPKGKLIVTGTFSLCRNPIYAAFILFIVPSIGFLTNSLLALSASLFMYLVFKSSVGREYAYLKEKFGEEYLGYKKRVNEMLPIPKMKK